MCGLVGYIPNKKSKINILRFKSLLLYNEDRGRLSTGIYNEQGVLKETISATEFSKNQQWHDLNKNSIFLGHTRQPTIGYPVTMHGAQPIEVGNIVMIHNGSIYNKDALAKKYKVKLHKDDTDSVVMAKILAKKKFEVLNDYNGAAALIWIYKDKPKELYVYKGESFKTSYTKEHSVERPLFAMKTKEGLYISSIEMSLSSIALQPSEIDTITTITGNTVYKVNVDDITKQEVVFRTTKDRLQTKVIYVQRNNNKNKSRNHTNHGSNRRDYVEPYRNKNYYSMWDEEDWNMPAVDDVIDEKPKFGWYKNVYGIIVWGNETIQSENYHELHKSKDECEDGCGTSNSVMHATSTKESEIALLEDEKGHVGDSVFNLPVCWDISEEEINRDKLDSSMIYYNKGRYWLDGEPVNGHKMVYDNGEVGDGGIFYRFIDGILLDNTGKGQVHTISYNLDKNKYKFGSEGFAFLLRKFSDQPIPYYGSKARHILFCKQDELEYDNTYEPLFLSRGNYEFFNGYYSDLNSFDSFNVGDTILTKDKEKVLITELFKIGFMGIEEGQTTEYLYDDDWVDGKIDKNLVIEEGTDDAVKEAEAKEVLDIALELTDSLDDAVDQLGKFEFNDVADGLIELIKDFKENKLAM